MELLPEAVRGGDDIADGGNQGRESGSDAVATLGKGRDLEVDMV
ncbi:hypothetical protein TIFTF001_040134 [Ficus carica]|uniref:Uncharacterized protein n=1 Tax=Ficus carica TaxID=3494 RepID=A0AA87YRX4_FICCA|nr:hypothetical protein TIFTF001_040134 [Ficus carica]